MKQHLHEGNPRTKYTSPMVQNELIDICGKIISDEIVSSCNSALFFGFIADEATDAAKVLMNETNPIIIVFSDNCRISIRLLGGVRLQPV